jgi:hypothetical protein
MKDKSNSERKYNAAMEKAYDFLDALIEERSDKVRKLNYFFRFLNGSCGNEDFIKLAGEIGFLGWAIHSYCQDYGVSIFEIHDNFKRIYADINSFIYEDGNRSDPIEYLLRVLKMNQTFGQISSN